MDAIAKPKINFHVEGAIGTYAKMQKPGYALMIEGRWGAGKTYFVRKVLTDIRHEYRYVTLNGVADPAMFRSAVLRESLGADAANRAAAVANGISKVFKLGDIGTLAKDVFEEGLLRSLPDTLVFDDIERAPIDHQVLLGLLNQFIEHEGKRLIMIVHSDEREKLGEFFRHVEKLVGKRLEVEADLEGAFPSFIASMPDGAGRTYLAGSLTIVDEAFRSADYRNLRVLRNAMRELCMVIDRVEPKYLEVRHAMDRFTRSYLALSMAVGYGEISRADIDRRTLKDWGKPENADAKERFLKIQRKHSRAEIFAGDGGVLGAELGRLLLHDGHAETARLNQLLGESGQFNQRDPNPLWLQLAHWGDRSWAELKVLVESGEQFLFNNALLEPGPFLHVADSLLRIEEYGERHEAEEALLKRILDRIDELASCGGVPPAEYGKLLGWECQSNRFSFGGYGCEPDKEFFKVMGAMRDAQMAAHYASQPEQIETLQKAFGMDLDRFLAEIEYRPDGRSLHETQFVHLFDMSSFVEQCLLHLREGRTEQLGRVLEKLAERQGATDQFAKEIAWLKEFRPLLTDAAIKHSALAASHLGSFLRFHWKFK